MANLTTPLNTEMGTARVFAPVDPGPSPFAALANIGNTVLNAANAISEGRDAAARREREQVMQERQDILWAEGREQKQKQEQLDDIQNEITLAVTDAFSPDEQDKGVLGSLNSAKAAANAGSISSTELTARIEKTYKSFLVKYPENATAIADYFQKRGFDSYLFRDQKLKVKLDEAEKINTAEAEQKAANYAYSVGAAIPGVTPQAEAKKIGTEIFAQEYQREQRLKQINEESAVLGIDQKRREALESEKDTIADESFNLTHNHTYSQVFSTAINLINSAENQEDFSKIENGSLLPRAITFLDATHAKWVSAQVSRGIAPEKIEKYTKLHEENKKRLTSLIATGDQTQNATTARAVKALTDTGRLNAARAYPLYTSLVQTFGQGTVNELILTRVGGVLSEKQITELEAEIKRGGVSEKWMSLGRVSDVLKGERSVDTLKDPNERRTAVSAANAQISAHLDKAAAGDADAIKRVTDGVTVNINAFRSGVNPNRAEPETFHAAARAILQPKRLQTLLNLAKDPGTEGEEALIGSRGVAASILTAAQTRPNLLIDGNSNQRIVFEGGRFVIKFDEAAFRKTLAGPTSQALRAGSVGGGIVGGNAVTESDVQRRISEVRKAPSAVKLQKMAESMNLSLDYLEKTKDFSPNEAGLKPQELRAAWATGKIGSVVSKKIASPELGKTSANFDTALSQFESILEKGTQTATEGVLGSTLSAPELAERITQNASSFGVDLSKPALAAIIGNVLEESSGNSSAEARGDQKDGSSSVGLFQHGLARKENLQRFAEQEGTSWQDPNTQIRFALLELSKDHPETLRRMNQAKTAEQAANIFAKEFLRPAGAQKSGYESISNISGRRKSARDVYTQLGD